MVCGGVGTSADDPAPPIREDDRLNDSRKQTEKRKRVTPKAPVQMVVTHEFVGTKTVTDAFIPIIYEDIHKTVSGTDTLDTEGISA